MRTKHYGRDNKGFEAARVNRMNRAIMKHSRAGCTHKTCKQMHKSMANLYGADYLKNESNDCKLKK